MPFLFDTVAKSDLFFRRLVDKKNDNVKLDIKLKTNEEYISVTYECIC